MIKYFHGTASYGHNKVAYPSEAVDGNKGEVSAPFVTSQRAPLDDWSLHNNSGLCTLCKMQ